MESPKKKVLIVGAGLAGLAMYLALDKKKFEVKIAEQKSEFKRLGYALVFMPLGVRALKLLGFSKTDIASLGRTVLENCLRDKNGKLISVTDCRQLIKKFDNYMMVTRERLYRLLERDIPRKDIVFGVTPKNIMQLRSGKVRVSFSESKKAEEYDIVIGADGVNSGVRKIIFPKSSINSVGLSLFWMWIPEKDGLYPKEMGSIGDEKAGVGFFNSGEKNRSCMGFFIETKSIPKSLLPRDYPKFLRKELADFKSLMPKILKHLPPGKEMFLHEDHELKVQSWHKGNVVLIGDAAHARSVFSGAGSALALEDALVLGHYLNHNSSSRVAIKNYYKIQHSRVEELAMSKIRQYLQDQSGVAGFLEKFFASSLLYSGSNNKNDAKKLA